MLPITSPPIEWPDAYVVSVRTEADDQPRPLSAVVLAAGEGTRMRSTRPKPLHLLCGRAMLLYVLDALADCEHPPGGGRGRPRRRAGDQEAPGGGPPTCVLDFVEQHVQRGTGDAVSVGLTAFPDDDLDEDDGDVLVLPGDTPLLRPETIAALVAEHHRRPAPPAPCSPPGSTTPPATAGSCGARTTGSARIVEHADATDDELRRSTRSTRRSTASAAACWPRRCAGSAPRTPRASTT